MNHEMKLNPNPFDLIKSGNKTIEVRLFDEKRQQIKVGDTITFYKLPELTEQINVEVEGILIYKTFINLFSDFSSEKFGVKGWSAEELAENMSQYYSKDEQNLYGVVGIKVKLVN